MIISLTPAANKKTRKPPWYEVRTCECGCKQTFIATSQHMHKRFIDKSHANQMPRVFKKAKSKSTCGKGRASVYAL